MPTVIGNKVLTLRDIYAGRAADGRPDKDIVEMLFEDTSILDDMVLVEANDGTTNKTTIRTGISAGTWTAYYEGPQPSKGQKKQVKDVAGHLESMIEIAKRLFDDAPDKDAVWQDEITEHGEGMSNDMVDTVFYGNVKSEPRKFNGIVNWYNTIGTSSHDSKDSAHYVLQGAKASSPSQSMLRSVFLVGWGRKTIHGFYPQHHQNVCLTRGTVRTTDASDANSGIYEVMRQTLSWDLGLSVKDYRYGGRLANLELDYMYTTTGQPDYVELIRRLITRVKNSGMVRQALYMEPQVWEAFQTLFYRKTQGNAVTYGDVLQRQAPTLMGIPVRLPEALETNETLVV